MCGTVQCWSVVYVWYSLVVECGTLEGPGLGISAMVGGTTALPGCSMVHYGTLWYAMVRYGTLWYAMVRYSTL